NTCDLAKNIRRRYRSIPRYWSCFFGVLRAAKSLIPKGPPLGSPFFLLSERSKTLAQIGNKSFGLLPGRKVGTRRMLVVKDKVWKCLFRPVSGDRTNLFGEGADDDWDLDAFWRKECEFVFPIEAGRRYGCIRQPVKSDVVENLISGKP